mgnify:FL=1
MAMSKIDRIDREIEKTRGKITEYQNRLKELEAQRTEQENFEIVNLVRSMCMSRDELMNFLRGGGNDAPPVETAYHEQEDMTDDQESAFSLCIRRVALRGAVHDGFCHRRVCGRRRLLR